MPQWLPLGLSGEWLIIPRIEAAPIALTPTALWLTSHKAVGVSIPFRIEAEDALPIRSVQCFLLVQILGLLSG